MSKNILEIKIQNEADWLVEQIKVKIEENSGSSEGINPKMIIVKAVNNVISGLVFGKKCSEDEDFEEKIADIEATIQNISKVANIFVQIFFRYLNIFIL